MGPNKYIHITFAIGVLLVSFVLYKAGDWVWSYFAKPNDLVLQGAALGFGLIAGVVAYRNERVFAAAVDVTRELEKVTWPNRKETYYATIVVLVTVAISTLILSVFDAVWAFLVGRVLK